MDARFTDQIVLIIGASAGVGAACARRFAAEGAEVVMTARGTERLEAEVQRIQETGGRAVGWTADLGSDEDCDRLLAQVREQYGRLDVLVNNAGLHHRGDFGDNEADALADMVTVNLRNPIRLSRLALSLLSEGGGAIVNVASLAGCVPVPGSAVYSATKFGLRAFSLALATELEGSGVTVSVVSPGPVETGFILDDLEKVTDLTLSQPMVSADAVALCVLACAADGKFERKLPRSSGLLATAGYLFPSLKVWLKPLLERKGARAKRRLLQSRTAPKPPAKN